MRTIGRLARYSVISWLALGAAAPSRSQTREDTGALLTQAQAAFDAGNWTEPGEGSANRLADRVLLMEPGNETALGLKAKMLEGLLAKAEEAQRAGDRKAAFAAARGALAVDPGDDAARTFYERLMGIEPALTRLIRGG
jgi:hypothetical protein